MPNDKVMEINRTIWNTDQVLLAIESRGLQTLIDDEKSRVENTLREIYLNRPIDKHEQTTEPTD